MLWNYMRTRMLENPKREMREGNRKMTYEEVVNLAEEYGKELKGDCYGILCQSELTASIALLSCLASGVTALPLPYGYGKIYWERIIEMINPPYMITDTCCEDSKSVDFRVCANIGQDNFKKRIHEIPALIMCDSEIFGNPDGAMISKKNILENIKDAEEHFHMNKTDEIVITRPLYHWSILIGKFLISLIRGTDIIFQIEN